MYCRVNEVEHVLKMKHLSSWRSVPIRYFSVQSESAKDLLDKLHSSFDEGIIADTLQASWEANFVGLNANRQKLRKT